MFKKLELLSVTPEATHRLLLCSPNFPRASYLDEGTLTYEPIVIFHKYTTRSSNIWLSKVVKPHMYIYLSIALAIFAESH